MTSSSFFRARRSADPKPIHYGSFARESRNTSSLNDLSAAWENVDEARTALEAVEARIHEANVGVSRRTADDDNFEEPPIREVFSQNQRLGRVSRYELRPTVNERQYSRDMDHPSRHHLLEIPSSRGRIRNSHTPSIQSYNGSKYNRHSPPSRDLRTISPPYLNDTDAIESSLVDDNLSLKRDIDDKRTREETSASATNLGTSTFEDSLEVPSIKRSQLNGFRPLSPKSAIVDHSEALARLKERIKKQKERTPVPKQKENEDAVVNVIHPSSEDRQAHDVEMYTKPVCKRKVVIAAPPTGYKGFSIPESTTITSKDKEGRTQSKNGSIKAGQKRTSKPQKPNQSTANLPKGGVKMRRITAPRPPMDYITPFSWRTGVETVKKVLGPSNTRPKSTASTRAQSAASQNTTITSSRIENGVHNHKDEEVKVVPEEKVAKKGKALEDDTTLSEGVLSEGLLSEDAKNVLSDLEMDSDHSDNEGEPVKEAKPKLDTKNVSKRKSSSPEEQKTKKVEPKAKKRMVPKHKSSPDTISPQSGVQRHYDVDKVKKYMEKKMKDKKVNMRKEKQLKQDAVDGRKKRLEELYNKQKKILTGNLAQKTGNKMGETHVIAGNLSFQHQPYDHHSEFFYQDASESEKESTDVASFKGLPGPSERKQQKPTVHDFSYPVTPSDVSSEMSVESLERDYVTSPDRDQDKEDNKADLTLTPDETSFTRISGVSRQMPGEERDNTNIYPGFPAHDVSVPRESSSSVNVPMQPHTAIRNTAAVHPISDLTPGPSRKERIAAIRNTADVHPISDLTPGPSRTERIAAIRNTAAVHPLGDLTPGPSRTERIAAIRNTAAQLKQRLEREAKRLGLSLLDKEKAERTLPSVGVTTREHGVFRGNLPGVSNLHEQAELNEKLESMNTAATRIQAVYRGYSTRQGLNWKLPSGRTLGGIIRNAPRQTAVEGRVESIPLYLASDASSESNLSDVETAYSHVSDRSLHSRNRKPGSVLESRSYSAAPQSSTASKVAGHGSSLSRGHYRPSTTLGKSFTDGKGDRMSVINIYLRNLNNLRQGEEERPHDADLMDEDTASLYSDSQIDKTSDTASLLNDIEDLKEDDVDLDKTLVKESPPKTSHDYESMEQELDDDEKLSPSVDHSYSQSISSHGSPSRSSLTLSQTESEYSPVRPSVKSTTPPSAMDDSTRPTTRYPPPVYFPRHQGGDRMSPGSLDQRMMAELNRLEFMEESVRQLTDIERTNSVSLAQQETVSLAQILKAKQASYAKDMESLQLKAQQEKMDAARQLDEARHAAVQSSINAQQTVAKVKTDAANSIAQSTERLVMAQTEASHMTTVSAKRVEQARTEAARTLLDAANKQATDVRVVASSAASAAAQEAVRNTLEQFRQDQRSLRKHDTSYSTPESRSRSSYSRDSYTDERSPSYSRSRSSRIATEIESGASKRASGNGYTSDEFESFKESEVARSVRTASPGLIYPSDKVDSSFVADRERSGNKSSESIPEEVDLSVSESSVVSDIVSDKSIKEAAGSSGHKTKDKTDHDYSMNFDESMMSSRNVTDDELDYRLILPSEGHRRRSIGKTQRSGSICSDAGTVSYSSDENADKHLSEPIHEKNTPFSGEDSFSKFTIDMVKLMREEEVRAKHLEALLHLREKALKENTTAEMDWLELQKKQMRDKGADDVMPFIKKRQRDVIKRLKAEKAEIKYLMAANRAASYDRKLLMINQEEITRLRRSTQKIRGKVREEEAGTSRDKTKNELSEDASDHTRRSTPLLEERPQDESPSKSTTVPEEISAIESPTADDSSFPTYDHESAISERVRKRSLSEGESDDGAPNGSIASKSKGSPTSSDSIVMQQLKKLKSQSSERYLTQREQKLMRRKHEREDILLSDRKLIEWERHLDEEQDKLNDVNRIKSQKSKRAIKATQNKATEEDLSSMAPDRSRENSIPEIDSISKDISEASDHSDVETRIRELRQELQQREREVRRLHKEKKRQKRAMLHEEEDNLRKKLQAVERILQQTKENFDQPAAERKPETAPTTASAVHTSESKESIPEKSSSSEGAQKEESRRSVSRESIPEKSLSDDRAQGFQVSEGRQSIPERSSSSEGLLKGFNVVLDLDFDSQDREAAVADNESLIKSVSEVQDLDIRDQLGLFSSSEKQLNHSPSYTEEIEDNARTAEDISQASEIQTISGASGAEVPSRSLSRRSDEKRRSRAESEESLLEVLSFRSSRRPDSENSVPEELSIKSSRQSVDESISEALSRRVSQRSGSESIAEALSVKSSHKSGSESISEALSDRSSRRSEDQSLPEVISARSSKAPETSSRHSKSSAKDYSNTFESERTHDEGDTEDDISEQIIEEEDNRSPDKETTQKSYTSDFEVPESPKLKIGDALDTKEGSVQNESPYSHDFELPSSSHRVEGSLQNESLYSQDFELPSSSHRVDQPSLEKRIRRYSQDDDLDELTQRHLSQASNEESIVEEVPEDRHSIDSGSLSDASDEMTPRISLSKDDVFALSEDEEDKLVDQEKDTSQFSQDFESPSSHIVSKHSSGKEHYRKPLSRNEDLERKLNEEPQPRVSEATDDESVAEEIPEDRSFVESGGLSDASDKTSPRLSSSIDKALDNAGQDTAQQPSKVENEGILDEEKETSQYSQHFQSQSSHRLTRQSLEKEDQTKPLSREEPERNLDISSQHRLSEATDEGSVVEELPDETLETGALSDADEVTPRFEIKEKTDKMAIVVLPSQDEDEEPLVEVKDMEDEDTVKKSMEDQNELRSKQASKISHDLSNTLIDEAVSCITSLYDEQRLRATLQELPVELKTSTSEEPDKFDAVETKADSEKENSESFNEWGKAPEEGFEVSEGEDLSISEKLSFAEDDESLPILDLKPLVSETQKDQSSELRTEETKLATPKDDKTGQGDAVVDQLSQSLLKEAASKMIELMHKKEAKFKEENPDKTEKELPKSPPLYSPEHNPQQRGFDKFMAVHRFPDGILKQVSPPGSPTKDTSSFDKNELADKLSQLKLLHEELGAQLGEDDDDDDDDDFVINENKPLELPTDTEEFEPPSGQSIPIVVPHESTEVVSIVTTSLSALYHHKKAGGSLGSLSPPSEFSENNIDNDDPDSKMKQSYRRMIFDLTGDVFRDVLNEESPPHRPPWMKHRRRRKNRFYHALSPMTDEHDYLPIVQQRVLDLVGLGNERPNLDTLRRKTPLKVGKKDFVDAVLIQELREEEPQWVDYDDDELAVKFQVADAIFESLMSETVMILNAIHRRKESTRYT